MGSAPCFMKRGFASLDRIGSFGALLAAIAAPCCFPLFGAVAASLGLGILSPYESIVLYLFQTFAVISLVGLALAFRQHGRVGPLTLGLVSAGVLAYTLHRSFLPAALYGGLFGLLVATVWNYFSSRNRRASTDAILQSVITCSHCGRRTEETMPTNACLFFYDCPACHAILKPHPGDCCVFCSYGSVPCPPIQIGMQCCG